MVWKDGAIINTPSSLWLSPYVSPSILSFPHHVSLLPFSLLPSGMQGIFLPDLEHNQPINPALLFPKTQYHWLVSHHCSQLVFQQAQLTVAEKKQDTKRRENVDIFIMKWRSLHHDNHTE